MASQRNPYGLKRERGSRQRKRRRREIRRAVFAAGFVMLEVVGFWLANFAQRDSWTELLGFLLLQPLQMGLNLLDGRFQLTRGMSDRDAVLLVTLLALPLNLLLWYAVWRGWRKLRRSARERWHAARSVRGSWKARYGASAGPAASPMVSSAAGPLAGPVQDPVPGGGGAASQAALPEIEMGTELPHGK